MDEWTAFLTARLDEEAAAAREGQPDPASPRTGEWTAYGHHPGPEDRRQDRDVQMVGTETEETGWMVCEVGQFDRAPMIAAHIARHDPARVLREVEADRELLNLYERARSYRDQVFARLEPRSISDEMRAVTQMMALEQVLRLRAAIWSDHPDYPGR